MTTGPSQATHSHTPDPPDAVDLSSQRIRAGLIVVVLLSVAAGIWFRVIRLERGLFWFDECYTALKLSGHRGYVAAERVLNRQVRSIAEVRQFQRLDPQNGFLETLKRCAGNDPQVAPLHCLILRVWAPIFGDSVMSLRAFSVVLGILCLPAVAWLAHEVAGGGNRILPLVAIALMAVSPFELVYSREAREYALWTLLVLLTSATLLRALRTGRTSLWILYSVLTALALYSHLLHVGVLVVQGIVVLLMSRGGPSSVRRFILAGGAAVIAFSPWMLLLVVQARTAMDGVSWTGDPVSARVYFDRITRTLAVVAIDFGRGEVAPWQRVIQLVVIGCVALSIFNIAWRAGRTAQRSGLVLLLLLTLTVPALMGIADLLLGGARTTIARYEVPSFVGLILILSCVVGSMLQSSSAARRTLGWISLGAFVIAGVYSGRVMSSSQIWWNKSASVMNPGVAEMIRSDARPLLIMQPQDLNFGNLLSLSHLVDDRLQIIGDPPADLDLRGFDRVLLYNPTAEFLARMQSSTGRIAAVVVESGGASRVYELR